MQALILVGGFATRLRPFTDNRPKALIPIMNKPMIMHLIDKVSGIVDDVILAVNYGKEQLEEYFNSHDAGVNVILHPESEPLGTGGAIKNAEKLINDTFIVFNGDVITSIDINEYIAFHNEHQGLGCLALWEVPDPSRFGIVAIDRNKQITNFKEKPNPDEVFSKLINAGTYILEPEILKLIPGGRNVSIEREIFPKVLDKRLFGFEFDGYWFDAGTPEIFLEVHRQMMDQNLHDRKNDAAKAGNNISPSAQIDYRVLMGKDCEIGENTILGPNVFLGDHVKIGEDCNISESIIDCCSEVGSRVTGDHLIIARKNKIESNLALPKWLITGDDFVVNKEFLEKM
jgi:mannose-1-phosphate guanylyltransferase